MHRTASVLGALVLLLFTGLPDARAEGPHSPVAGPVVRVGSAVGFTRIGDRTVSTLGGQIAIGIHLGALAALDVEYEDLAMLQYVDDLGGNEGRGHIDRLGVTGRLFLLHFGQRGLDPISTLRLYVEGGAGRQRGHWSTGEEFARGDLSVGGGWLLDHRTKPLRAGVPSRSIGWQFGWRLSGARADGRDIVLRQSCKGGKGCPPMPGPDPDVALLVTCSMRVAW